MPQRDQSTFPHSAQLSILLSKDKRTAPLFSSAAAKENRHNKYLGIPISDLRYNSLTSLPLGAVYIVSSSYTHGTYNELARSLDGPDSRATVNSI